jgi:hypothetical protein
MWETLGEMSRFFIGGSAITPSGVLVLISLDAFVRGGNSGVPN